MARAAAGPVAVARHLVRAAHAGPSVAVTSLTVLLSVGAGNGTGRTILLGLAVLTGQLTIGWTNDLLDAARDQAVGRTDKPVATGELSPSTVRTATVVASAACIVLSLLCGVASAIVHLLLSVGGGWAYNAGLKRTQWSWVPYAVAFGALPAVVVLAGEPPRLPPLWMMACGALLGVGAHFVNVLPDLADDAATGVQGLPHRLGERRARVVAAAVLFTASVVAALGPPGAVPPWVWAGLALVSALAAVAMWGTAKAPFWAAVAIAVIDVTMLVLRG